MNAEEFKAKATEASNCARQGLDLLIETFELQEAVKNLPKNESYEQMMKEIIEKEKIAIKYLEKGTLIQRSLIKYQHESILNFLNNLP